MSFVEELVQNKVLTSENAASLDQNAAGSSKSIETLLVEQGISTEDILKAKGDFYDMPTRSLDGTAISNEILRYIPEESVRHYRFVPLGVQDNVLEVGVVDPENIEARDALQFIATKLDLPFKIFVVSEVDFLQVLENYKTLSGEVTKALSELETELSDEERELGKAVDEAKGDAKKGKTDATRIIEDAPVTKIVATILRHAIEGHASDIHIEPMPEVVRVRFRIDGVMHTSLQLPMKVHSAVVARVKILSNMKLDEKRKPQDNRFSAHIDNRKIDFRVSTFPTYYGEKVVMRILDPEKGIFKLDSMGLSERNTKLIRDAITQPFGMILISGPTGSGKTSTLYAMLNEIDKETKNVLSLEDPVEYSIGGMSQSQVRPEIGYTFANGLRTTLRQDPDVIMVGEIRDKETAALAIQAALTGHLVLSTIHTNNAVGVISRLIDMDIDPYLIPPTLILAMAQRLVRKICPKNKKEIPVEGSMKLMLEKQFEDLPEKYRKSIKIGDKLYEAKPSEECPNGTKGRVAVFEVLDMNRDIEKIILENPSDSKLLDVARKQGMLTMKEDAIIKALAGDIPFSEINTLGGIAAETAEEII